MNAPRITHDQNLRNLLVTGDLLGVPDVAMRIAKRGGNVDELFSAYLDRGTTASPDRALGIALPEAPGYSLCSLIRAQMEQRYDDARHERDVSAMMASKTGKVPHGEFVPLSVLARNFDIGTASEAGNLVGSARLGALAGDPLRKVFTLARLGATMFSGLSTTAYVPVFGSTTEPAYNTETGAATSVLETTRVVDLTPRRIAAVFVMSRQALFQATPDLEGAITRHLSAAINDAMQKGILAGDGTGNNPTGILNDSSVNIEVGGTNGATLVYQHLVNMEYAAAAANNPANAPGWVINPATAKYLRTKTRGTYLPEILGNDNKIIGAGAEVSGVMPSDLTKGGGSALSGLIYSPDWSQLLIGLYGGGIDITVDRVTLADQGKIRIIAALEVGFGLRQLTAFSVMKDAALV